MTGWTRRVGIEEELLLVDEDTLRPVPAIAQAIGTNPHGMALTGGVVLEHELKREQLEVVSPPLQTFDALRDAVVHGRRAADDAARSAGARAVALATAPFAVDNHVMADPRYERMRAEFGLVMREQLTCGFHVHTTIRSRDEGVAVLDRIRPWLPVLLALSANSPFWRGDDSEFASFRYQAWGRWPTSGPSELFGSGAGYDRAIAAALATGVPLDVGMMYFDARLSSHVPTVEVRICDVVLVPEDAAVLGLLVRALVERAAADAEAGVPAADVTTRVLRLASWRASRSGLSGELVDPLSGTPRPAADVVRDTLEHVRGRFTDAAEEERVGAGVARILERGTGAALQRAAHVAGGSLTHVVADAVARTHGSHETMDA